MTVSGTSSQLGDAGAEELARQQAALRRVAVLVAEGAGEADIFERVAHEISHVLGHSMVSIDRYDSDASSVVVASINDPSFPVGSRWPIDGPSLGGIVLRTRRPARIDDYADLESSTAEAMRKSSVTSAAGVPIMVSGRVWGLVCVATTGPTPLAPDTEARLLDFTELLATAITSTEARAELAASEARARDLAAQQAALGRVATLVAEGVAAEDLFAALAEEIASVVGLPMVTMSRFEPDESFTIVGSANNPEFPVGSRWAFDGPSLAATVRETGRPARIDDYSQLPGQVAAAVRGASMRGAVAAPIVVDGKVWGHISLAATDIELPPDAEERLAGFAELVSTAIANRAARDELQGLASEQAALRRVATVVAGDAAPNEVFAAVAKEVGELFDVPGISMVRFGPDGGTTEIGGWGLENPFPPGTLCDRHPGVDTLVWDTGKPARIRSYAELDGYVAETLAAAGFTWAIGAPIVVEGRTWGAMAAMSMSAEQPPEGAENRLSSFTELVATAIANAEAGENLRTLVDEQAALRRVATLVAEGVRPAEIFAAVTHEVERVFGLDQNPSAAATVVRFDPDSECVLVGAAREIWETPLGMRWQPHPLFVSTRVLWTGRPARVEEPEFESAEGPDADKLRQQGYFCQVGSPIVVEGRLWGAMTLSARDPLPRDTEERLEKFTELAATAIANADSRETIEALAEEQAALRRVATLVARGMPPGELLLAVAEEAARALNAEAVGMVRFDGDGGATLVAQSQTPWDPPPLGTRLALDGDNVVVSVHRTGQTARTDDWTDATGSVAAMAEVLGVSSAVATPIVVEGRLWGTMIAATSRATPLPADVEARIGEFTELVATAIANAESRAAVAELAEEQAALRRVATLVAQRVPPDEIFNAVAAEVAQLFDLPWIGVMRYEPDESFSVLATWGDHPFPPGTRLPLDGPSTFESVYRTGRPAVIEDYSGLPGTVAEAARKAGIVGGIGAPIVVEGTTWGVIAAPATADHRIPEGAETRLNHFTELMATAVANAEGRERLRRLGEQQEALRRIATLVAKQPSPGEVFTAVTEAVGPLLGADLAAMHVFIGDGAATVLAGWSAEGPMLPLGTQLPLDGDSVAARIFQTAGPARMDDYGDTEGETAELARDLRLRSTVGAPIIVEGRLWGALMAATRGSEPLPEDAETRIAAFTELVATAISNAENRSELAASRARVIAAADDARRRIERDLHDGAQQRLVTLAVALRRMEGRAPPELRPEIDRVAEGLTGAIDELREMSRGIHPAVLTEGGLSPALKALGRRSPVRVKLDIQAEQRLPDQIEVAAYYIVSEAMTNASKHANAKRLWVTLRVEDETLRLSIRDDGDGGADPSRGSGLIGLADRVGALQGTIEIESPPGGGTRIDVGLPVPAPGTPAGR